MASAKHRERKLPVQQLSILAICRFAEPLASTSLYPYLPEMVESFEVPKSEVGKWAGFCAAIFSLCQAVMGIPWGRFSDRVGRKPTILLGLACTMVTSLIWGFSTSLPMAIVARALAGAGNGNVGIIRTTVAEMVPFKELQPRAFSVMPLVWNIGSIFGPSIGGALANPLNVKPGERRANGSLLEMFPYALPNIVSACFFTLSIIVGILFLEETLESVKGRRDYGLILGRRITTMFNKHVVSIEEALHIRSRQKDQPNGEAEPLLKNQRAKVDEEDGGAYEPKPQAPPPSWRDVLNRQAVINLVVYTLLAMHSMAFDQLVPVYMRYTTIGGPETTPYEPPLKFAGGFGLDHFSIGLMSTAYGVVGMVIQFFIFPPVARRYGILFTLKVVAVGFPIVYFLTPFTALLPTTESRIGCMFTIMILKCFCGIFAFPCNTILLTNSATSLRTLGTLNGIATSVSAIGRAAGPAATGAIMTAGVKAGYIIAPWWFLAATGVVAAVPVFWLVEGEGFGGDDEVSDDEEEEEVDEALGVAAAEATEDVVAGQPSEPSPSKQDDEHEEHRYGSLAALSRTNTTASSAVLSDDDFGSAGPSYFSRADAEASGAQATDDQGRPIPPTLSRRSSRRVMRRMSGPIGMGSRGISRRYSTNLGQSFGTSGSIQ